MNKLGKVAVALVMALSVGAAWAGVAEADVSVKPAVCENVFDADLGDLVKCRAAHTLTKADLKARTYEFRFVFTSAESHGDSPCLAAEPEFVHALRSDLLVECAHLALEELLAVSVWRWIAAEDVPAVGEELPADCASDLVERLAPVDHRQPHLPSFRMRSGPTARPR